MTLQADRIVNAAGANSVFNAGTLNLSGINSQSGTLTTGVGELVFNANEIRMGKNQMARFARLLDETRARRRVTVAKLFSYPAGHDTVTRLAQVHAIGREC